MKDSASALDGHPARAWGLHAHNWSVSHCPHSHCDSVSQNNIPTWRGAFSCGLHQPLDVFIEQQPRLMKTVCRTSYCAHVCDPHRSITGHVVRAVSPPTIQPLTPPPGGRLRATVGRVCLEEVLFEGIAGDRPFEPACIQHDRILAQRIAGRRSRWSHDELDARGI
jgi:hypothetical protein